MWDLRRVRCGRHGPVQKFVKQQEYPVKLRPLHDRLLVRRVEESRTSAGGIVIPDTVSEKPMQGEVIAVGSGKIMDDGQVRPIQVKVGDRILFGKYAGTEVKLDGEELVVMREDDVMAVLDA
jgi:chaperonin GroES